MSDQLSFGDASAGGEPTWTVARLNAALARTVEEAFPRPVWVRGEVQDMSRSKAGHTYFSIIDSEGRAPRRLRVVLLARERQYIQQQLADVPDFRLADGIEVRIKGHVGYYQPAGTLQLQMTGVDPFHTVGALAARREHLLRRLRQEGLTERNSRLAIPRVPLTVGLVTALESAAYNDVLRELTESTYGFRVVVCDARMQGVDGPSTVVRALRCVDRRGVDVIALVRGGGSLADLAAFDDERIARCIAGLSTPVLTGIGHEVDTTVADHVAHTRHKTPTAVARALVERARDWRREAEASWSAIVVAAQRSLSAGESALDDHRRRTGRAAGAVVRAEARRLESLAARASGPRLAVVTERQVLRLNSAARRLAAPRLATTIGHHSARLDRAAERLHRTSRSRVDAEHRRIESLAARARVVDPVHTLRRGYSITRDSSGRALRSVHDVAAGDLVTTTFADGAARSSVEGIEPSEEET